MESNVEVYEPSRLYMRCGWAALAGSLICTAAGLQLPVTFVPGFLCAMAAAGLFYLGSRPCIRVGSSQFNIGERAIAWREVREVNTGFGSPVLIRLKLTNSRAKLIIYPGESDRIARLLYQLRRHSYLATFDGVAYRDFWTWSSLNEASGTQSVLKQPVRMLSADEEDEIERMFQKLKSVGRLDVRSDDSAPGGD